MIDDECVNCDGSQTRDPTDPYMCSQSCASYLQYGDADSLDGLNTYCIAASSSRSEMNNYRFVDGRLSSESPTPDDIFNNCCEEYTPDTPAPPDTPARPAPPALPTPPRTTITSCSRAPRNIPKDMYCGPDKYWNNSGTYSGNNYNTCCGE